MAATKTKTTTLFPSNVLGFSAEWWVGPVKGGKGVKAVFTPIEEPQKTNMRRMGKPYIVVECELHPDDVLAYASGAESAIEPASAAILGDFAKLVVTSGVRDRR
jgi:hypothetical protein